jgi:hypothetical protein
MRVGKQGRRDHVSVADLRWSVCHTRVVVFLQLNASLTLATVDAASSTFNHDRHARRIRKRAVDSRMDDLRSTRSFQSTGTAVVC